MAPTSYRCEVDSVGLNYQHARSAPRRVRPNNSFNRTRYGKHRKPGLRHMVHHLSPGLRRLPPQAG
jgi:hypothetical protein